MAVHESAPGGPLSADEIGDFVARADQLATESHARRNAYLMSRWVPYLRPPAEAEGRPDPFGAAHQHWVIDQWRAVAGRPEYRLELEQDVNVTASQEQLKRLYPFVSGDLRFTAQYMMGVYFALQLLDGAPGTRAVEYGVGWGNTTVAMMQAGWNVLAVDIDPKWLQLLRLRAAQLQVADRLQTLDGEFGQLPADGSLYSAVVFFECFHHALNHDEALGLLTPRLEDGAVVLFAAETVIKDLPITWGLRLDGHSVWAIRRFGWMELGFNEDYFILLARRHNLSLTQHVCEGIGNFGIVWRGVYRKAGFALGQSVLTSQEGGFLDREADPAIETRFTGGDARLAVPCGKPLVSIELRNWLSVALNVTVRIGDATAWQGSVGAGSVFELCLRNPVDGYYRLLEIRSDTHSPAGLGMSGDPRELGIAVGRVRLHDNGTPVA